MQGSRGSSPRGSSHLDHRAVVEVRRSGHGERMTVYLAHVPVPVDVEALVGPWREVRVAAEGVLLVDSDDTLSRVFHELKWSLPEGTALLVVPVDRRPKLKGVRSGTQTWLRERIAD